MALTARQGSSSTKTYSVAGDTLADIVKDMDRKGPADPNESARYPGRCTGELAIKIEGKDVEFRTTPGKKPLEVAATLRGGSVTSSCVIEMPRLASDKALSAPAKKEWARFLAALEKHENGHADAYYAEAQAVAAELGALSGKATGKDENTAKKAALATLYAIVSKDYSTAELSRRVKASAKAYDAKNRHGESQGAVLDGRVG
jgi:predicted secreted Zn-dependent protease